MKLSFVQRMELAETGMTQVWEPPHVIEETSEVTWGRWYKVARVGRKLVEVIDV